MSLNLTFVGPPQPVTERGFPTKVYLGPDGDTLIYGNKTAVVARSLTDATSKLPTVYNGHRDKVNVARFSPNGNYVASGDASGKVRVWAFTHPEHVLKKEMSAMARGVRDISWDGEGKRLAFAGDGENKAQAVSWDTGSELGHMIGMVGTGTSVDFKKERPYRLAVGCEDKAAFFFKGPPFKKYELKFTDHSNMVTAVRFSNDSSKLATVSSDKTAHLYDGKSGEKIGSLSKKKKERHNGTIYAVDFSPDNALLLTNSSDKTAKLWDAGSGALVSTLKVGGPKPQIRDQQVGGGFTAAGPMSLSLSGDINIFDPESPDAPARVVQGHQATPVALVVDEASGHIFTGDMEGVLCRWVDGWAHRMDGVADARDGTKMHKGVIAALALNSGNLLSGGIDGNINTISLESGEVISSENVGAPVVALETASKAANVTLMLTAASELVSIIDGKIANKLSLDSEATCVAISADGKHAVVNAPRDLQILLIDVGEGGALSVAGDPIKLTDKPLAVAISPDATQIASGQGSSVVLIERESRTKLVVGYWIHSANVTTVDFSPDGQSVVSGAKDSDLSLWKPADKKFKVTVQAHYQGVIKARFVGEDTVHTVGADNCLRTFKFGAASEDAKAAGGGGEK